MNTSCILLIPVETILLSAFWLTWWFQLIAVLVLVIVAYVFHRSAINSVLHQKNDLERQLLERSELLTYAKLNEQRALDEAEQANRNKSQLLTKISHDIRTPMNTMMGMASLLNETSLTAEQQEYASTIHYSGEKLLSLINDILMNDILEYSKVESGKELEFKDFNLRNSLEEVLDVFAVSHAKAGLDLAYRIDKNVPDQIIGDSMRLGQVLMNLIDNSFRFTKKGEVFVGVKLLETKEEQIKLEFEVRDTGAGISSNRLNALASELSYTSSSNSSGGMGLVICKKLLNLMGGGISIDSRENKGTIVRFTIITRKSIQSSRPPITLDRAEVEGKKVLIVEDNTTVAELLKEQLEDCNLSVSVANSGIQALELLSKSLSYDLLLCDLHLPGINGIEIAQSIKKMNLPIPVIVLDHPGDEAFRKNPDLFFSNLSKPIKQHVLREQVFAALRQKAMLSGVETSKQKLSTDFAKQYPLRVLVAEDDAMNQKVVTRVLNKLGYEPHISVNGKDVLEEVSHKTYDIILMDVQMPEMDGLETTRMIRVCLSEQPVIIAMTANTLQGDRDECLRSGMDDYISKPVRLEELMNILEKWASKAKERL